MSARHLRRLFHDEVGKTPKQLLFENRLGLSRKLIVETHLPIGEIALASGFRSIRRFNDAFKDRFKRSPSQTRRGRTQAGHAGGFEISLPYRPPFDFHSLLHFYRAHQIGRLEWFDDESMHRLVEQDGKIGTIVIRNDVARSRLLLHIDFPDTAAVFGLVERVRALFDLDSDPLLVANTLDRDLKLKALLKSHPGLRLPSGWDPFEVAVSAILGQLVSIERGRALVNDLIELLGRDSGEVRDGQSIKLFPTPTVLAAADLTALKTTGARKRTLKTFAAAVASGELSLAPTQDVEEFEKRLLAIPGIGPWTASYMALKVLRHADAFPATDLILARALELHPREVIDRMSPWRGYVAILLWREYAGKLTKKTRQPRRKK
jgi:AraC family transcriptional regulator of adaptative response / DNA-3-methyladenine glycosylase II